MKIPLLILLFLCFLSVHAQKAYLQGGLNLNTAKVKNLSNGNKMSTGVNAGFNDFNLGAGLLTKKIKEKIDLRIGIEWTVKGYRDKFTDHSWLDTYYNVLSIENYKIRTRLNYLSIPLLATYYFNLKNHNLFVQAGGFASWGVIGTEQLSGKYYTGEKAEGILTEVFIVKERGMVRGDNGIIIGLGAEFDEFQFGLQYHRSTKNIARENYDIRNRTVCLYALVNFNTNKK
jgi:hypothetical protein